MARSDNNPLFNFGDRMPVDFVVDLEPPNGELAANQAEVDALLQTISRIRDFGFMVTPAEVLNDAPPGIPDEIVADARKLVDEEYQALRERNAINEPFSTVGDYCRAWLALSPDDQERCLRERCLHELHAPQVNFAP